MSPRAASRHSVLFQIFNTNIDTNIELFLFFKHFENDLQINYEANESLVH